MSQKELLYIEDGIRHESEIISVLSDTITLLEDEELGNYLDNQIMMHQSIKDQLLDLLKENAHE